MLEITDEACYQSRRVGDYREFMETYRPDEAKKLPSLLDSFGDHRPMYADQLINFILNAGVLWIGTSAHSKDVFTGEDTGLRMDTRSDGKYRWTTKLAYYIDRYNLELPEDFIQHALTWWKENHK